MRIAMAEPGRPKVRTRGPRTVERIVEAAHRLFLSRGFAETSMEAIAQEAGVSKATLYAHYGSRDELFTAVIWSTGDRFSSGLVSGVTGAADLRSKMERLAGAVLDLLLSPEVVATNRIVAAEARRFPELGKLFYENGPDRLIARLAEVFETAMAAGSLRRSVPRDVAKHFIGLIRGDLQLRAMLGDESALSATERNRAITTGVGVFLAAYAQAEPFRES
ncbi:TetR/AcrR family transcriptional regulator [Methylosinus sporium]|uniref:TetR/AcrR family transcriptional regulator n=1 Tax=Methylosinus sporium TaxID=428 RepID=A0A549SH96_METSR|nr:TetR/AcrR family transcriptional regulator [Methylosinus sp. KRF6]MBU3890970.1 TetR/AcrR family transcriptional regulator [Methylosinus sp. KRF6]TRL29009.1 TetR/AcrR family transcriptional regulator [Methylosinus sporium]